MTVDTLTHTYLVNGTYFVRYADGEQSSVRRVQTLVHASSELKAIMEAAHKFTADRNYTWFTWLQVSAKPLDNI